MGSTSVSGTNSVISIEGEAFSESACSSSSVKVTYWSFENS
jgi:hypothetical protein